MQSIHGNMGTILPIIFPKHFPVVLLCSSIDHRVAFILFRCTAVIVLRISFHYSGCPILKKIFYLHTKLFVHPPSIGTKQNAFSHKPDTHTHIYIIISLDKA